MPYENTYDNYLKYGMVKCGSANSGFWFLYFFYTAVNFIFFNILIALVLEAFEINYQQEATIIERKQIDDYLKLWT